MSDVLRPTPPRALSGFPEWLPRQKLVEESCIAAIRGVFSSYGYTPIETPAVELTEVLAAKGVDHKEIYSLVRLHAEGEEALKRELSLHFDLTVPFARYVAQHQNDLVFPFKRSQIQKVWRGERPAQGRFREFYQADADVICRDNLPACYEAEMLEMIALIFARLPAGPVRVRLNHRQILDGFYGSLGLDEPLRARALLEVDKLEKIGPEVVARILRDDLALEEPRVGKILSFAATKAPIGDLAAALKHLAPENALFLAGAAHLDAIAAMVPPQPGTKFEWCGGISRGLNYYTGVIFETALENAPELGSVCSGGRYDKLASNFAAAAALPGVGLSIGLTRLLSHLFQISGFLDGKSATTTEILMAVPETKDEEATGISTAEQHEKANRRRHALVLLAQEMRQLGCKVEVFHPAKLKKQLTYADRKGIAHVVIPNENANSYEWKDMRSGEQRTLDRTGLLEACARLNP